MAAKRRTHPPFEIGGHRIAPGERAIVDLPVAGLYTHTDMTMPVQVVHGRPPGPVLFLSAALHGDELNGVEIIRRVVSLKAMKRLHGTLLAVPVVNVFGFLSQSRYLPDRRDLNRAFPGSARGSAAGRLAHTFVEEVVERCDFGIDLHTGAIHRANYPQIRAVLDDPRAREMAEAFRAPVILNARLREGSLRETAHERGIPVIVYETGEALRFDELGIRAGQRGVAGVLRQLGMLPSRRSRGTVSPATASASRWVRAPASGVVRAAVRLGQQVRKGQLLARISDPFGGSESQVEAPVSGILIGQIQIPLVHEGDALYHLAEFDSVRSAASVVEDFHEVHAP